MQAASSATGNFAAMFVGRFVAGLGVGAASMLTPLYVSECAPRAVRGGLTCKDKPVGASMSSLTNTGVSALYQLFIVTGTMLAFWYVQGAVPRNYPSTLHFVIFPVVPIFVLRRFLPHFLSTPPPFPVLLSQFPLAPRYTSIHSFHDATSHPLSPKNPKVRVSRIHITNIDPGSTTEPWPTSPARLSSSSRSSSRPSPPCKSSVHQPAFIRFPY